MLLKATNPQHTRTLNTAVFHIFLNSAPDGVAKLLILRFPIKRQIKINDWTILHTDTGKTSNSPKLRK